MPSGLAVGEGGVNIEPKTGILERTAKYRIIQWPAIVDIHSNDLSTGSSL